MHESLFQLLVEHTSDMLLVTDRDGRIRYANPAADRALRRGGSPLLGSRLEDLVHPLDHTTLTGMSKVVPAADGGSAVELRLLGEDGEERTVEAIVVDLYDDPKVRGSVISARDVTARKRAAAHTRAAKEAAEQANRAKTEFLANVSHELRTPIAGVMGMTELALSASRSREVRQFLKDVLGSSERLKRLIEDLLDFSRMEAGQLSLRPQDFKLSSALGRTLKSLGLRADEKGLELVCHISEQVPDALVGDVVRLEQVVVNLVGNAIKFSDGGTVLLKVEQSKQIGDAVILCFSVTDDGPGIPEDEHEAVFAKFGRARSAARKQIPGTGLGLALCNSLVQAMGGAMELDSRVGEGSTFRFTARFEVQQNPVMSSLNIKVSSLRQPILVVDDNPANAEAVCALLRRCMMLPKAVPTAALALDELRRGAVGPGGKTQPYRVCVVDAELGDMNGRAFAEAVTAEPGLFTSVIVMLSSVGKRGTSRTYPSPPVTACVTKPVERSELLRAVLNVLQPPTTAHMMLIGDISQNLPVVKPGPAPPRWHVLIVDDDPVMQRFMKGSLEPAGYAPTVVGTGADALSALSKREFDAIVTDLSLPDMDGIELTKTIREVNEERTRNVPIFGVTAHAMAGVQEKCIAAGMDQFLTKPVRRRDLLELLYSYLPISRTNDPDTTGEFQVHTGPAFDRELAYEFFGDEEGLSTHMQALTTYLPKDLVNLEDAVNRGDAASVRKIAHQLKSRLGYLGSNDALAKILQLHSAADSGNRDHLAQLWPPARSALENMIGYLRTEMLKDGGRGESRDTSP